MIDTENIESKFRTIVNSRAWSKFCDMLNSVDDVYVIGNGGNWAVGSHGAVDNLKMSKNKRFFRFC